MRKKHPAKKTHISSNRRCLALALALVMLCSFMPSPASALDEGSGEAAELVQTSSVSAESADESGVITTVTVAGALPENVYLTVERVELSRAAELVGAEDEAEILFAYDIKVMLRNETETPEDDAEYQPDAPVTVTITPPAQRPIEAPVTVTHVSEDVATGEMTASAVSQNSVTPDGAVEFEASGFSIYIVTLYGAQTITFSAGDYTLANAAGTAIADENSSEDGIQVTASSDPFQFKIVPASGYAVTGVAISAAEGASAAAQLFGPDEAGVYLVNGVSAATGNQLVTIGTAAACAVTYHVNNSSAAQDVIRTYPAGPYTPALPSDINFAADAGYRFVRWNTLADGTGTDYSLTAAATLSGALELYAIWGNTAPRLSAVIYNSAADAASGINSVVALTPEGATMPGLWGRTVEIPSTKVLAVTADFTGCATRELTVTLPVGMVFKTGGYPTESSDNNVYIDSHTYTPADGPMNYSSDEKGGTLTYTINSAHDIVTLYFSISYSMRYWHTMATVPITDGVPSVTVALNGGSKAEEKIFLSKVYASELGKDTGYCLWNSSVYLGGERPIGSPYVRFNTDAPHYFEQVRVVLHHPYAEKNGERHYLTYSRPVIISGSMGETPTVTVDNVNHTTTIIGSAVSGTYAIANIVPYYDFSDAELAVGDTVTAPLPEYTYKSLYGTISFTELGSGTITILEETDNLEVNTSAYPLPITAVANDVTYAAGHFYLKNSGTVATGKLRVSFSFAAQNGVPIGVVSARLPAPPGTYTVSYTVVDQAGNAVPGAAASASLTAASVSGDSGANLYLQRTADMKSNNWYFSGAEYDIESVPASASYGSSTNKFVRAISSGLINTQLWGSVSGMGGTAALISTMTIADYDEAGTALTGESTVYTVTSNVGTAAQTSPTFGLVVMDISNDNPSSGGELTITVAAQGHTYCYSGGAPYVTDPKFFIRLPEGFSIKAGTLSAQRKAADGSLLSSPAAIVGSGSDLLTQTVNGVNYTLTPVTFAEGTAAFGRWNENGSEIALLWLTFTIQCAPTAVDARYDIRNIVWCVSDNTAFSATRNCSVGADTALPTTAGNVTQVVSIASDITTKRYFTVKGEPVLLSHNSLEYGVAVFSATLISGSSAGTDAYQWQRSADGISWEDISGAQSASYTPAARDVGKVVRVQIQDDGAGDWHPSVGLNVQAPQLTVTVPIAMSVIISADGAMAVVGGSGSIENKSLVPVYLTGVTYTWKTEGAGESRIVAGGLFNNYAWVTATLKLGESTTEHSFSGSDIAITQSIAAAEGTIAAGSGTLALAWQFDIGRERGNYIKLALASGESLSMATITYVIDYLPPTP